MALKRQLFNIDAGQIYVIEFNLTLLSSFILAPNALISLNRKPQKYF